MMDIRKSLHVLQEEAENCTACDLGVRRKTVDGPLIFGQGRRQGILFIGDGPTEEDEKAGRPFDSGPGLILRKVIEKLGLTDYYFTNLVACRSCAPWINGQGQPVFRKNWKTKSLDLAYKDEPPTPIQIEACLGRLHQEIYLVDPVLIVTLGPTAAKALTKKPLSLHSPDVRGQPIHISIPGAGHRAVLTEKNHVWLRKTKAGLTLPIERSEVRYLCIPTLHPELVQTKLADQGGDSLFRQFANDIQKAVQAYERYMLELYGTIPSGRAEASPDVDPQDIRPQET